MMIKKYKRRRERERERCRRKKCARVAMKYRYFFVTREIATCTARAPGTIKMPLYTRSEFFGNNSYTCYM